jgi:hypothetical protein
MSKKSKKNQLKQKPEPEVIQSSVSFSFNKWFKKILTAHPSELLISVVIIGYAVFMFGGGLYTVTSEGILHNAYINNKFYFLYPSLSEQFTADTVISVMLYLMGFAGLLTVYQSTKSASKPRQAYMLLAVGISLVVLSYIFLESAISIKIAGVG